jgi:hypothetical protein
MNAIFAAVNGTAMELFGVRGHQFKTWKKTAKYTWRATGEWPDLQLCES